ncbi:MAG: TolC family protein [Candidatus Eisenbacteria bacterium]|nr:TolC family protein [Candidatus Eisenbacteria bacterium]
MAPAAFLFALLPAAAGAAPWTLERVLQVARERDPLVRAAHERGAAGRAEGAVALASLSPRASLTAGAIRGDDPALLFSARLRQGRFTAADFAPPSLNQPPAATALEWGFTVEQPLWNGGAEVMAPGLAAHLGRAASAGERAGVANALLSAVSVFLDAVRAEAALRADSIALAAADEGARAAASRFRLGQVPELDTLRASAHAAGARADWLARRSDRDLALTRLSRLVGERVDAGALETPAGDDEADADAPAPGGADGAEGTAPGSRAARGRGEVEAARERAGAEGVAARRAGLSLLPSLNARAGVNQYRDPEAGAWTRRWSAGLALDLPLWDGARRIEEWRAARARARAAAAEAEALERELAVAAEAAAAERAVACERRDAMRRARDAAEEAQRLALDRYRAGLLPLGELLNAEAEAARARQGQIAAEIGVTLARYHYLHATGGLR